MKTKRNQIIYNIVLVLISIIIFAIGYMTSFYCSIVNVDYSTNYIETYENCTVNYSSEDNEIIITEKNGDKTIYKGMK